MKLASVFSSNSWNNPDITLYHGTTAQSADWILDRIDASELKDSADFGRGFYTTTNLEQARLKGSLLDVFKGLGFERAAKRQRTEASSKPKSKGRAVLEPVPGYTSEKRGTKRKPAVATNKSKPKARTPKKTI